MNLQEGKENIEKGGSEMKNNNEKVEVVFIMDRSGSMGGLEADTIGGFNSMLAKQKEESDNIIWSTVLFDHISEVVHDRVPVEKVRELDSDTYYVRGSTALLDAVGGAIHHIGNVHKYAREEDRPSKTLFVITTDGMENSSRQYSYDKVKKMIEKQKEKYHWEFIFLGANIDAVGVADRFGVDRQHAVRYECDSAGTALNFQVMNKMVSCARGAKSAKAMNEAFCSEEMLDEVREDYKMRHKQ